MKNFYTLSIILGVLTLLVWSKWAYADGGWGQQTGHHYVHTPSGHQVVSPGAVQAQNTVSIYVPNDRGGYVTVVLKRSGRGFMGPEGEFYPVFPEVSRLQIIYGG